MHHPIEVKGGVGGLEGISRASIGTAYVFDLIRCSTPFTSLGDETKAGF